MSQNAKVRSKKKLGSYPSVSVVFSISLALFVMGLFGILITFSKELELVVQKNIKIHLYLKNNLTDSALQVIQKNISRQDFIYSSIDSSLVYISKEKAAKQFIKETGEDFYQFLGENPLHDSFVIRVAPEFQQGETLVGIKKKLEKIPGVYLIDYNPSVIDSVNKNRNIIGAILLGCAFALFTVVILLINNTLKLALFSQRFLIRSMQLVGATNGFITKPFLWKAAFYGLIGAVISSAIIIGLLGFSTNTFPELRIVQNRHNIAMVLVCLAGLGIFVAVLSTFRALKKYLALSLDELY